MKKPIGRIIATEKVPTTMDKFTFWTDSDLKLHAFDIVKVKHIDDSYSFGVIENISHITDAQSFLTSFISSDFGDVTVDEPTLRVGMNYVEASVSYNNKNLYTPVHNNEPVYLACDAIKMRELITASEDGKKYTASEVLSSIYKFDSKNTGDKESHWFKVEMIGINDENTDLLDFTQIKEYLSFVAPVPYQNTFLFRAEVYKHAKEIGCNIDEYNIFLNGEQIFKKYKTIFKTSKGEDEVFNLAFKEIYDSHNHLLAWLWIGVSHFKAIISKECKMRGLRLRKENIQIGSEDALQKLFKEDRGQHYFVGEVFAVSKDLIPNSQRDYVHLMKQFDLCMTNFFINLKE